MEYPISTYKIAAGFVAYVWLDGIKVVGTGPTVEVAEADLKMNIEVHKRLQERVIQNRAS
jgi:hypothetical protein